MKGNGFRAAARCSLLHGAMTARHSQREHSMPDSGRPNPRHVANPRTMSDFAPRLLITVLLLTTSVFAQTSANYHLKLQNDLVAVYDLDLPSRSSVPTLESAHDNIWIALTSGGASFSLQQGKSDIQFEPGDARFFPSFETKLVTNAGTANLRAVVVALKPHGLISNGCECTGKTGKTVCGCKGGSHLEPLWAFTLGDVTLAGTSLGPGEAFRGAAVRDDMLLVAITNITLRDEATNTPDRELVPGPIMNLNSGDAVWIKGGRHELKDVSAEPARFVTVEF